MVGQVFRYLVVVSALMCNIMSIATETELNIPNQMAVQLIKQQSDFKKDSYQFEYYFDDGTIATGVGTIDKTKVYGKGFFRFKVQWRLYELRYETDSTGTRGVLAYLSASGAQKIEETFFVMAPEQPGLASVPLTDFHFGQFRLKPNFLIEAYFPAKDNDRPPFSVEFVVEGEIPSIKYKTYDNRTVDAVSTTMKQADTDWVDYQKKMKIKTLGYDNHYDEAGNYILKYVFDNGLAICEIGKRNDDNTITVVDGHIIVDYNDFLVQWNYTSDAKQYNVVQINDDKRKIVLPNGPHTEKEFRLKPVEKGGWMQAYSDGINKFEVQREFTEVNGQPFIRAVIKCNVEYLGGMTFDINEQHPYGILAKSLDQ